MGQLEKDVSETGGKFKQLEQEVRSQRMKENKPEASPMEPFDVKTCRSKLAEHYERTAIPMDIHEINTRLSWVKEEEIPAGSSQSKLTHYTDVFTPNKDGAVPKRILVQGQTDPSPTETFDVKIYRSRLAEHYKRTAKVPTSVWRKTSPVDIHQIYTRLTLVKEEQTPAGSSQSELTHYTDVFTPNKNGVVPNRILVQGQTGIGKSTFVKKLAVDWAELYEEKTEDKQGDADMSEDNKERCQDYEDTASEDEDTIISEEYEEHQKNALEKFELVLVINLIEASKCQSLRDVISRCSIFPEEETALTEGLLSYITKNQEKVLLVFDGYDEYRCGSNSEIYEIFRGKKLRNCCVLITTRISKADELREFKDMHAEITGLSREDREAFMKRLLGGKTEAKELRRHLSAKNLEDLARVPLLLLFFCTLWKKGELKYFPETKTKLYLEIVQHVLYHSQGKQSPARFGKVQDFKEILAEIGKVALECLLKNDHVFEYDQLSAAILCEESLSIGLLQVTECAEYLRPVVMVSFIHKRIQEFLAAWYITYRCVPEGNLGGIEEHAPTLEDCEALENVFQFICGLSDDGAVKVLEHLTSVRISDPTLDLSKTIPDVKHETDVPLCDVTDKHYKFSDLVYSSFQEVHSKAELLSHCFNCTGGIVLVTEQLTELLQKAKVKDLTKVTHSLNFLYTGSRPDDLTYMPSSTLHELLECLDCLHLPLRITKSSEVLTVGDFLRKFQNIECNICRLNSMLCFCNGQFQFYITELNLSCVDHVRLFTETTDICGLSFSENLCSEQSCLKFLTSLKCFLRDQPGKALGGLIRNCKHLKTIEVAECDNSICDLLEQVVSPSKISLKIGLEHYEKYHMTSAGAVKLARLLPLFDISDLSLDLSDCDAAAVDTLVPSITHKTLKILELTEIRLTPAVAATLGRSLPEMSSLQILELTGTDGSILQGEEMEALFGGFNKTLPLYNLTFSGFSVISCLAPLTKSFRFFPNLGNLYLKELNMDERNLCDLLESLRFIPNLEELRVTGKPLSRARCCTAEVNTTAGFTHKTLRRLELSGISLTPAVAATLGRSLPKMLSLVELKLTGADGSILQAEEMKALFGGFNKTLPLYSLCFSGFSTRGSLAPLAKSLRFFPNLFSLDLSNLNMDEHDLRGLLESFQFIPELYSLNLSGNPLGHAVTSIVPHVINLPKLAFLSFRQTGSEEDFNYVRETIKQAKPLVTVWTL